MLIREPELGYNMENKRAPRGGRALKSYYSGSYAIGHGERVKRNVDVEEDPTIAKVTFLDFSDF